MKVSVIIPSLNPDEKLMEVIEELIKIGFQDIIVINDGSDKAHQEPFQKAEQKEEVTVLHHKVNRGKGAALKTGFRFCMDNRSGWDGVVTADGDHQHKAEDILCCCRKMLELKNCVILGARDFSESGVPFRSRAGNHITSFVFRFACGIKISDTQTGLRAIPFSYLEMMERIAGERYEYETNMLLELKSNQIKIEEVPIATVYIDENATTHFHPVRDSFKIYGVIIKYFFGAAASFLIDIGLFALLNGLLQTAVKDSVRIFAATVGARMVSSVFNYSFNRKAVFEHGGEVSRSLIKYYILCVVQMLLSYGLVYIVTELLTLGAFFTVLSKIVIDSLLFMASFQIQRVWVFKK